MPDPPGPSRRWGAGLEEYERDRPGHLLRLREQYGDVVAFGHRTTVVNGPAAAATVLRSDRSFAILGSFLGRRLTVEAARDRAQGRRHLNAGLRRTAVDGLAAAAEEAVLGELARAVAASGPRSGFVDPLRPLERAVSAVVTGFAFGRDAGTAEASNVAGATAGLLDALSAVFGNPFALPVALPTPAHLRIRRRYQQLRSMVVPLVEQRVRATASDDFAAVVTASASAAGLGVERIADLLIGALLAAYRVPAAAACWALLDLARNPLWSTRALAEPSVLRAVLVESGRLHPPTWLLRRVSTEPVRVGGYDFPAGQHFLVSPYVLHRDARSFPDPLRFEPGRWLGPAPAYGALLTFGNGAHRCPGRDAGDVILMSALRAVLRTYAVSDASSSVRLDARTTLVPSGLRLRLSPTIGSTGRGVGP
ncbi:cytochrome P450 [Pimelobacter simplex]|uniref:cytochrome P450 n=1 Tax=Nocardioides simplex TaxID=2045 RepID=UPI00366E481D